MHLFLSWLRSHLLLINADPYKILLLNYYFTWTYMLYMYIYIYLLYVYVLWMTLNLRTKLRKKRKSCCTRICKCKCKVYIVCYVHVTYSANLLSNTDCFDRFHHLYSFFLHYNHINIAWSIVNIIRKKRQMKSK